MMRECMQPERGGSPNPPRDDAMRPLPARRVRRPAAHKAGAVPPHRRGFTLIEILATLVLVAIILPVAMSGISLALGVADQSRRQTEAASLAQTKMAEIIASQQWQTSSLAGDFAPDRPEYRWVAQVTDWQGTTVKQLDVQVLWNQRGGTDKGVTLSTLVYTGTSATTGTTGTSQ
jgi:prepilin-type N-terminal cleavage/methylation domain-containing protein